MKSAAEDASGNVVVLDLSLRNPLTSEFSGLAPAKLLSKPALLSQLSGWPAGSPQRFTSLLAVLRMTPGQSGLIFLFC